MLKVPLNESTDFVTKKEAKTDTKACTHSILALQKDLTGVDKAIKQVIKSDPELHDLFEIVTSIKGVGVTVATEVIITTNEFKDITDPKKFARAAAAVMLESYLSSRAPVENGVNHK